MKKSLQQLSSLNKQAGVNGIILLLGSLECWEINGNDIADFVEARKKSRKSVTARNHRAKNKYLK